MNNRNNINNNGFNMTKYNVTIDQMPVPLAGQAMYRMGQSDFLNPVNQKQEVEDDSIYIDKTMRAVARIVYAMVVPALCGVAGIIYHGMTALIMHIRALREIKGSEQHARYDALADAHTFAAMVDAVSLILDLGTLGIFPLIRGLTCTTSKGCAIATAPYFSPREIITPQGETRKYYQHVYRELSERAIEVNA